MPGLKHFFDPKPIQGTDLTVKGIGVREGMAPSLVSRPSGTGDFFFLYCPSRVLLNATWQESNSMIIWKPGQAHTYGNPKRKWSHSWMHCDGTLIKRWVAKSKLPLNQPFQIADPAVVEEPLLQVLREITHLRGVDKQMAANMLENFIRRIGREVNGSAIESSIPESFIKTRYFLQTHFEKPLRLEQLAANTHISVPHFCAEFKKHFKCAPIEYVIRLRLKRAVYLLHNGNLRIGEVARLTGYQDAYHFSKLFKKHYGTSPMGMRKKLLEGDQRNAKR